MTENKLEPLAKGSEDGGSAASTPTGLTARWAVLLIAYAFLLVFTGYVAFFQQELNPALAIDDQIQELIADETTRDFTIESLREDSVAFKSRRDLAVQSFNIVLGAALGFLSATAAQQVRRSDATGPNEQQSR